MFSEQLYVHVIEGLLYKSTVKSSVNIKKTLRNTKHSTTMYFTKQEVTHVQGVYDNCGGCENEMYYKASRDESVTSCSQRLMYLIVHIQGSSLLNAESSNIMIIY